jgi:hypothetical protein
LYLSCKFKVSPIHPLYVTISYIFLSFLLLDIDIDKIIIKNIQDMTYSLSPRIIYLFDV